MYKYLVAFVLLTPLIGIWMIEAGEYAPAIGVEGYPNGATLAYAGYAATVAIVAWLNAGTRFTVRSRDRDARDIDALLIVFGRNLLVVSSIFLAVLLFSFDAINVWTGELGKGQFRVGLGQWGAVPNLMTKCILPALLAYAVALYRRSSRRANLRWLVAANCIVIFIIGASWGFKSAALMMLVPALLMLYWRISISALLQITVAFIVCLVIFFYVFDAGVEDTQVHTYLFDRITVRQGDVAWYIWEEYVSDRKFPDYWPTLLAAVGDKVLIFFGLSKDNFAEWTMYHYDYMLTYLAGASPEQIEEGHSLTATPFAEGLVASGIFGVAVFALLGGIVVGRLHWFIGRSLSRGQDSYAALGATYFCFYVFPWLNGGAVIQLFHVSVWFSIIVTLLAFKLMSGRGRVSNYQLVAG